MTMLRNVVGCTVVLAAALYFGRSAPPPVLLALVAGLALVIGIQSPQAALLTLPPVALFASFSLGTGTGTPLNATVLCLVALLLVGVLRLLLRRERSQPLPPAVLPLIALNLVVVLAALVGSVPLLPLARTAPLATQMGAIGVFTLSTAALILAYYAIRDTVWLARFTYVYIIATGLYLLARFVLPLRSLSTFFGLGADGS
ncbi:MAG TPA: hypothetical protein VHX16_18960, partial [Chloroflexota bacterium]|nr:hypothetical protein [Chloroflexota bacterium]